MRKLTIPLLVINFLLVLGCSSNRKLATPSEIVTAFNPYFTDTIDYVYRTKITVYGNELNGILLAKKINDSVHRVVLTTDFGNTLLDFEVGKNSFKKNNIIADLNRKIIVNTLRDDFRLLFREKFGCSDVESPISGEGQTYKCFDGREVYSISFSDKKLISISKGSRKKENVFVGFHSESNTFAEKVEIRHHDLKLRIEMNHFIQ